MANCKAPGPHGHGAFEVLGAAGWRTLPPVGELGGFDTYITPFGSFHSAMPCKGALHAHT